MFSRVDNEIDFEDSYNMYLNSQSTHVGDRLTSNSLPLSASSATKKIKSSHKVKESL